MQSSSWISQLALCPAELARAGVMPGPPFRPLMCCLTDWRWNLESSGRYVNQMYRLSNHGSRTVPLRIHGSDGVLDNFYEI